MEGLVVDKKRALCVYTYTQGSLCVCQSQRKRKRVLGKVGDVCIGDVCKKGF